MKLLNSRLFYLTLFILGVVVLWLTLFETSLINDTDKQIAYFIGSTGLLFSFIQFQIHQINRKHDYLRDIRYGEYQRLRKLINNFANLISENMMLEANPNMLENNLSNLRNEISEIMKINNDRVFKEIMNKEPVKEFDKITEMITKRASKYRKEHEHTLQEQKNNGKYIELEQLFINMSWHNETSVSLHNFYKYKSEVLNEVQKYLFD